MEPTLLTRHGRCRRPANASGSIAKGLKSKGEEAKRLLIESGGPLRLALSLPDLFSRPSVNALKSAWEQLRRQPGNAWTEQVGRSLPCQKFENFCAKKLLVFASIIYSESGSTPLAIKLCALFTLFMKYSSVPGTLGISALHTYHSEGLQEVVTQPNIITVDGSQGYGPVNS